MISLMMVMVVVRREGKRLLMGGIVEFGWHFWPRSSFPDVRRAAASSPL